MGRNLASEELQRRQRRLLTRRSVSLENGAYLMTPWPANGSDRGIGVRGTNLAPH
jgi:hypothetical protein